MEGIPLVGVRNFLRFQDYPAKIKHCFFIFAEVEHQLFGYMIAYAKNAKCIFVEICVF